MHYESYYSSLCPTVPFLHSLTCYLNSSRCYLNTIYQTDKKLNNQLQNREIVAMASDTFVSSPARRSIGAGRRRPRFRQRPPPTETSSRQVKGRRGLGDAGRSRRNGAALHMQRKWRSVGDAGRRPRSAALGMQGCACLRVSVT
jgi:hypothetical protein